MIEREVLGTKPVVPLNPQEFRRPLGPGYKAGWYAWEGLAGRMDNCEVAAGIVNRSYSFLEDPEQSFAEVQAQLSTSRTFEEFGGFLEEEYHSAGHNTIGFACSPNPQGVGGVMVYSEASARDPIFYRWHAHIEDIVQQFKDTKTL